LVKGNNISDIGREFHIERPAVNARSNLQTPEVLHVRPTQCHPVPGGYKYGNLALQVSGVLDETVKYGFGF
jgi:hypothetical protein